MLFHTYEFFLFFILFLLGLTLFHGKARIIYTCLASYVFYAWWYPPYLLLLVALTFYAHVFSQSTIRRGIVFAGVIFLGLLPLILFKYTGFVASNVEALTGTAWDAHYDWRLPLGISFVTFSVISYVIDVREARTRFAGFWTTALYISFFPHLIAGPILRAQELMPQLTAIRIRWDYLKPALLLFTVGVFKKVFVADQIAPMVDQAYGAAGSLTTTESLLAFYGFAVQIYCDFSGYTDMALALALFLNVRLPINFNRPYLSSSIREFWTRWHMTLSRWLRDYVYIPLGGSRNGFGRMLMAVMLTMLLGGLWHGAAWTFVVWGAFHGIAIAAERVMEKVPVTVRSAPLWLRQIVVFHVVCVSWVFFRATSFENSVDMFEGLFRGGSADVLGTYPLVLAILLLVAALHPFDTVGNVERLANRISLGIVVPLAVCVIGIGAALSLDTQASFIYFDF